MKNKKRQSAFSIVEMICVLSITGALVAILLPAIQNVREASRNLSCKNKLRQIGLANLNYESAHQNFPPGNLGFADVIIGRNDFSDRWNDDENFEFYWKKAQHTSALSFVLPFLDQTALHDSLPRALFSKKLYGDIEGLPHDWVGSWGKVQLAMQTRMPHFLCPSDSLGNRIASAAPIVGAQPVYFQKFNGNSFEGYLAVVIKDNGFHFSNYIGCAGAYSGGNIPDRGVVRYRGVMGCREPMKFANIADGTSNTILFGESLGLISDKKRLGAFVWTFGCIGRGRGGLPWGKDYDPRVPNRTLLGDWTESQLAGFGSKHPMLVNNVLAGGSVKSVNRNINLKVWYALCGMSDGEIIAND